MFINWKDLIITNTKLLKSLRIRQTMQREQPTIGDILCENVKLQFDFYFVVQDHVLFSVPHDDCLHQVLFLPTDGGSAAAEAGGDKARV